jgi:hypothetical protein
MSTQAVQNGFSTKKPLGSESPKDTATRLIGNLSKARTTQLGFSTASFSRLAGMKAMIGASDDAGGLYQNPIKQEEDF